MKSKLLIIFGSFLILATLLFSYLFCVTYHKQTPDFFVGVDVAYADLEDIKRVVDEVNSYTNLFVIGSKGISHDPTKLDEMCQYLTNQNMQFIVYTDTSRRLESINDIVKKYEDNFIGIYYDDEQGGRQLDLYKYRWVMEAENYTDAANQFVSGLNGWLNLKSIRNETFPYYPSDFPLFTSDYSLYWFDYQAGYNVVFAEFGWNYSRQLNVALNRGAATMLGRDWGVIITWTFNGPPYIESGPDLFNDLVFAYDNGAKYVVIFDSDENYTTSILKEEHYKALEQFWQYTKDNPRSEDVSRVAFVLPKGFGYGFRGPEDKIWGLWEADETSLQISYHLGEFLQQYGTSLDVIYDDNLVVDQTYCKYIFWNGTVVSNE